MYASAKIMCPLLVRKKKAPFLQFPKKAKRVLFVIMERFDWENFCCLSLLGRYTAFYLNQ